MQIAKVFKCGNSQAVRLPKKFQFKVEEVEIFKRKNELVIREIPKNLGPAFDILATMPDDFMAGGRCDSLPQKRKF